MIELFANDAQSTLAGAITSTALTAALSPGSGALFPAVTTAAGTFFRLTFRDQATMLQDEIVFVTNLAGDVITMLRAQEGTTAQAWSAGDIAANLNTAGAMGNLVQTAQQQSGVLNYAVDTGAANALIVALTPAIKALTAGLQINVQIGHSNTGASTIAVNGLTAVAVVNNSGGGALNANDLLVGSVATFTYDGTSFRFEPSQGRLLRTLVYTRIAGVQNVSINGGAPTPTGATLFTPLAETAFALCEVQGGGGAGGGAINPTAGQVALGAPGSSGSYGKSNFPIATIGASQAVTVGLGGAVASGLAGGNGGASSIGAILTAGGGGGGSVTTSVAVPSLLGQTAATAGAAGANMFSCIGVPGGPSIAMAATVVGSYGGQGGGTVFGTPTIFVGGNANGVGATTYGAGGSGTAILNGAGPANGGGGAAGIVIIEEYAK